MRSTNRWIITGLALSVSMGAQASVLNASGTPHWPAVQHGLFPTPVQYQTPETRAREQEDALRLSYSERRQVQSDLKTLGFNPGPIDGAFGRLTRRAIWDWQYSMDYWASGYLTRDQVRQLRKAARGQEPKRYSEAEDRRFWEESGAAWGSIDGMRRYLERYPDGIYSAYARDRLGLGDDRRRDEAAWREARDRDTVKSYQHYLERFPKGRYATSARARLNELKREREEIDWRTARREDTIEAYRTFLRLHPESRKATEARKRIEDLRRGSYEVDPNEMRAWRHAQNVHSVAGYRDFLRRYPNGHFAKDARLMLQELERRPSKEVQPADRVAFSRAAEINTIAAYKAFMRDFPNSEMVPEARRRIEKLRKTGSDVSEAELKAWRQANRENTIGSYRKYLSRYPNGHFVEEAKSTIRALEKRKPQPSLEELKAREARILRTEKDVRNLVEGLRRLGYLQTQTPIAVTPEVRDAIRRMQRKIKQPQTGYVDEHVWSVIATVINTR